MGLLDLFIAASIPVLKVLLVTLLGLFLALDKVNILGEDARKHLNNIVFYVFNPALVSSNLASTITFEIMVKLWFMPFNILITYIVGSLLGWIIIHLTRTPTLLKGLVIGSCAAGNMGSMLFIIIPAVCKEKGSPFGASSKCRSHGLAYASLSMAVGAIYLWSYVYNIVRLSSSVISKADKNVESSKSIYSSSCESPGKTVPLLSSEDVISLTENNSDQLALPCTRFQRRPQLALLDKMKLLLGVLQEKVHLKKIFAPSTIAAILGFIVGTVPLMRKSMIGDEAPLRVVQDSALLLGDGSIPALILITGANLLKGLRGSEVRKSLIFCIIVARYVALPIVGILVVKGAVHFGFVPPDPLFQFVLLLQFAVPPAINIGTMTQLFGAGESEFSVIMLWTYSLASISLTIWSTIFMWMVAR